MFFIRRARPLLALILLTLALLTCAASRQTAARQAVSLRCGEACYTFTFSPGLPGQSVGAPQRSAPDIRRLRTRTVYTLPVYSGAETPGGTVTLTLDESGAGTVFYLESDAPGTIDCRINGGPRKATLVRYCPYGGSDTAFAPAPVRRRAIRYGANTALYLSGGTNLYLSRLALLTPLGQTVYARDTPESGAVLARGACGATVSIPLHAVPGSIAAAAGAVIDGEPINWADEQARQNVSFLDADKTDYRLLSSGVYQTLPDTYLPQRKGGGPHVYRSAAAWLLGPCSYESNGPLFSALGRSILYSYLDAAANTGFIPTEPTSMWLRDDYGIGPSFYDTRFNFDTISRLMRVGELWREPLCGETVQSMLGTYLRFADSAAFTVDGIPFTPDYGDSDLTRRTGTACSLNHYLTEGLTLLQAGEVYENQAFIARGHAILRAIDRSAPRWIRENGDLWYAIRPDGQMEKDDYVTVTYNDLISAARYLDETGVWSQYAGLQALLQSKERYLAQNGFEHALRRHPAFRIE